MIHKKITVKRVVHREQRRVALFFDFDQDLIDQVKTIPGVRWSKTMGCWHIPEGVDHSRYLRAQVVNSGEVIKSAERRTSNLEPMGKENRAAVQRFREWMGQRRYSRVTIDHYVSRVMSFLSVSLRSWDKIEIGDIEKYNFQTYIKGRKKGGGYSAQNIFISALKLFYKSNRSDMVVPDDITRPKRYSKLPQVLSTEEVKRIFGVLSNLKHRTLLMLIYSGGLRIGETLRLKKSDINFDRGVIEIHGGKGAKDRQVPLSKKIMQVLQRYYEAYAPKEYVFEGRSGGPYSDRSAQQVLKTAVKKAGIDKRVTLHTLRHSYATHLMEKGVGLRYIQDILGHRSPKTTMIYTHVSGRRLRDVVSPLDDMDL